MRNKDKYSNDIFELFVNSDKYCEFNENLKIHECNESCGFCKAMFARWLQLDYIQPIVLSDTERTILENMQGSYEWMVRDKKGHLRLYKSKPYRNEVDWWCVEDYIELNQYDHLFTFAKWENPNPLVVKDILENVDCE